MSGRIEVRSAHALSALKSAFERISLRIRELGSESNDVILALRQRCRHLKDAAREEVREAQRELADADESGRHRAQAGLDAAEARLQAAQRAIDRVEQAVARLRRQAANTTEASGRWGSGGAAYLGRKMGELKDYYSLNLDAPGTASSSTPQGTSGTPSKASTGAPPPTMEELQQRPLPRGWKWVRLEEIDDRLVEGTTLTFKGDSRQKLADLFDRLRHDVLPELDLNWGFVADRLRRDDMRAGIHDSSGKLGAFEAFFSPGSSIHLQRRAGEELYTIDDGRHRVEMAHQKDWPAVPAKAADEGQAAK